MTDAETAKIVISSLTGAACVVSFLMGRLSTRLFAEETQPTTGVVKPKKKTGKCGNTTRSKKK